METRKLVIPILTYKGEYCNDGNDLCDHVVRHENGEVWCYLFHSKLYGDNPGIYKRCFACFNNEEVSDKLGGELDGYL